jgi:hypothetical protein
MITNRYTTFENLDDGDDDHDAFQLVVRQSSAGKDTDKRHRWNLY